MGRAFSSALVLAILALPSASAEGDPFPLSQESQVKAAFLYNFLRFVDWPAPSASSPWVIAVVGDNSLGEALEETVHGKALDGRRVEIRRYSRIADVRDCQILFVGRSEYDKLGPKSRIAHLQPGVLTVGESPGFLRSGGIVNFYLDQNRVRFEIKPEAARAAGLRISSRLLKLGSTP